MFSFTPDERQMRLKEEIKALFPAEMPSPNRKGFDRGLWRHLGHSGLPGMCIPQDYGGMGLGALDSLIALEALGHVHPDNGFNFSLAAHLLACVVPLWQFGSDDLRKTYLPELSNGTLIAANAMTEPSSGSDAFTMLAIAEPAPSGYRITGTKSFASNGPIADNLLLYAASDPKKGFMGGISAFWIDTRFHSFGRSAPLDKAGLINSPIGNLYFDNMTVDTRFRVGAEGRGALIFNRSMEWERTCLGGLHLGNGQRLIDRCRRHFQDSFRSGLDRNSQQAAILELASLQTDLEAVRWLAYASAWKMDQNKPAARESSMAKLAVSQWYRKMTSRIVNLFAITGVHDEDANQSLMDSLSSTIYSGTTEMQQIIISQSMGL